MYINFTLPPPPPPPIMCPSLTGATVHLHVSTLAKISPVFLEILKMLMHYGHNEQQTMKNDRQLMTTDADS